MDSALRKGLIELPQVKSERDDYKSTLIRIATEDYRGPEPATRIAAKVVLMRYGWTPSYA
jgi:hypothetical protein